MDSAYDEYVKSRSLFDLIKTADIPPERRTKSQYEWNNIIERRCIKLLNARLPISSPFDGRRSNIDRKMLSEMSEKHIRIAKNPAATAALINNALSIQPDHPKMIIKGARISYGQFEATVPPRFRSALSEYPQDLLTMLLQYSGICGNASNQWGVPRKAYDLYYDLGARGEGFASPFNSRFIDRPDTFYCSVFDIDRRFGSAGNFFDVAPERDTMWVINPPYIDTVMESMAEIVLKNKLKTFITIPNWTNFGPVTALEPYLVVTLKARKHHYEAPNGKYISATFETNVYCTAPDIVRWQSDLAARIEAAFA